MSVPSAPRARVHVLLLALAVVLSVLVAGCGWSSAEKGSATGIPGVTVSGDHGKPPSVRIDAPLDLDETDTVVLRKGSGEVVRAEQPFSLHLTLLNGRTGRTLTSTHDDNGLPLAVDDTEGALFPVLLQALEGKPAGTRLLVAAESDDAYGDSGAPQYAVRPGDPVVMVADIIGVPPADVLTGVAGPDLIPPRGTPDLSMLNGYPAAVQFPEIPRKGRRPARPRPPPAGLKVIPLVQGQGPAVRATSLVTLDYLGQVWGARDPFVETFSKEPGTVALGTGSVVGAWEKALIGVTEGSRVMVIAPPAEAFGAEGDPPDVPPGATVVYVIDVLGTS